MKELEPQLSDEDIINAFNYFDLDKSNTIEYYEFKNTVDIYIGKLGFNMVEHERPEKAL